MLVISLVVVVVTAKPGSLVLSERKFLYFRPLRPEGNSGIVLLRPLLLESRQISRRVLARKREGELECGGPHHDLLRSRQREHLTCGQGQIRRLLHGFPPRLDAVNLSQTEGWSDGTAVSHPSRRRDRACCVLRKHGQIGQLTTTAVVGVDISQHHRKHGGRIQLMHDGARVAQFERTFPRRQNVSGDLPGRRKRRHCEDAQGGPAFGGAGGDGGHKLPREGEVAGREDLEGELGRDRLPRGRVGRESRMSELQRRARVQKVGLRRRREAGSEAWARIGAIEKHRLRMAIRFHKI